MVVNAVALSPNAVPAACGSTRAPNRVVISTFKQDALMIMEASRMLHAGCECDQDTSFLCYRFSSLVPFLALLRTTRKVIAVDVGWSLDTESHFESTLIRDFILLRSIFFLSIFIMCTLH